MTASTPFLCDHRGCKNPAFSMVVFLEEDTMRDLVLCFQHRQEGFVGIEEQGGQIIDFGFSSDIVESPKLLPGARQAEASEWQEPEAA